MNFEIKSTLKGISITEGTSKYLFKRKLFSLSAVIEDENRKVIATLKRNGWLHLSFILETENEKYEVTNKWGETTITSLTTGACFRNHLTNYFYNKNNTKVTELSRAKRFGSLYKLVIDDPEHSLALLMMNCMAYESSMEGVGAGVG